MPPPKKTIDRAPLRQERRAVDPRKTTNHKKLSWLAPDLEEVHQ